MGGGASGLGNSPIINTTPNSKEQACANRTVNSKVANISFSFCIFSFASSNDA